LAHVRRHKTTPLGLKTGEAAREQSNMISGSDSFADNTVGDDSTRSEKVRHPAYEGTLRTVKKTRTGVRLPDNYKLKARMVGDQLICIRGRLQDARGKTTDTDSFIANLYLIPPGGGLVAGVWSGRDDAKRTAFTAPFVLSERPLSSDELRHASYIIMLRTLTDVRALAPEFEGQPNQYHDSGTPSDVDRRVNL
jgi:hypothetical protein